MVFQNIFWWTELLKNLVPWKTSILWHMKQVLMTLLGFSCPSLKLSNQKVKVTFIFHPALIMSSWVSLGEMCVIFGVLSSFFFFFFSLRDRISKLVKGNCTCKFQVSLYTLETLPQCSLNFSFVFFACSLHCNIVCFFLSLYSSPFSTEVK